MKRSGVFIFTSFLDFWLVFLYNRKRATKNRKLPVCLLTSDLPAAAHLVDFPLRKVFTVLKFDYLYRFSLVFWNHLYVYTIYQTTSARDFSVPPVWFFFTIEKLIFTSVLILILNLLKQNKFLKSMLKQNSMFLKCWKKWGWGQIKPKFACLLIGPTLLVKLVMT